MYGFGNLFDIMDDPDTLEIKDSLYAESRETKRQEDSLP